MNNQHPCLEPVRSDPLARLMFHAESLSFLALTLPEEQGGLKMLLDLIATDMQTQCDFLDDQHEQEASHAQK